MRIITFTIKDPVGLHARPVTKLVQDANTFYSDIVLHYNGNSGSLKSIFSALGLAIPSGASVELIIDGIDEDHAYTHFSTLVHLI
jgi:phosphocarrier protein